MIRNLHLIDFLKLGQMHQLEVGLNLPGDLISPPSPLTAALTQHLPHHQSTSFYIYEEDKKPSAYLQARARQRREEWEIISLGLIGNGFAPEETNREEEEVSEEGQPEEIGENENTETPSNGMAEQDTIWSNLIEHMVIDAGEKGVERLFARLNQDTPEFSLFTGLGFHTYTHESLYVLEHRQNVARPQTALRSQRKRDLWHIQRLYEAITPSPVIHTEQFRSDSWDISRSYFPGGMKEAGWVLRNEPDEHAGAYIRITSHRNRYLVRVMNLDNQREMLPELFRFALSRIKAGPDTQVICSVREYEAEQESLLEEMGFKFLTRQAILVKHIAHLIKVTEKATAIARERRMELPQTTASLLAWHLHPEAVEHTLQLTKRPEYTRSGKQAGK